MLLARLTPRSRPLWILRASCFGFGNGGCNNPVAAMLVLNRAAGGVPGKRRKFKGDFKASHPPTETTADVSLLHHKAMRVHHTHQLVSLLELPHHFDTVIQLSWVQCRFLRLQMDGQMHW